VPDAAPRVTEPYGLFDPLIDLRAAIVDGFVDDVDEAAMQRAAMDAMVRSLGDPYSAYVPPEADRAYRNLLLGNFVGIGITVDRDGDRPVVIAPLDDSPALAAGILPGDVLLAVDGRDTKGVGDLDLESMLTGPQGSKVRLELRRTDGTERTVEVMRAIVGTTSVKGIERADTGWRYLLDRDRRIAYVRIAAFTGRTVPELDAALARIRADGVSALVLDLRGNAGGPLQAAVETADRFLASGGIVSTRRRDDSGSTRDATSSREDLLVPMVVLVDRSSASASEVVAGALQENRRAVLVGTRTFGKGSVQEIRQLPDGAGAIRFTVARYYLPSGASVTRLPGAKRWGVEPETGFRVPMTTQEMQAAGLLRLAREAAPGNPLAASAPEVDWASPESVREFAADPQLAAAIDTLQGFLDAGEWRAVGDLSGDVGAGNDELRACLETRRELLRRLRGEDARISELRDAGAGVDDPLLAADADLIDGEVTVRDRDGRVVGRWIIKDPASLRGTIGGAAAPAPEYTPATEPEPGGAAGATPK
jgi:carboxyl-terminal processing protease